jgi:hypothetical protein
MSQMFRVYFINLGYFADRNFSTVTEALQYGRSVHFEFSVYGPEGIIASWSPISGTSWH